MNSTVSSNSGRRKWKWSYSLHIFLLFLQKLPPSHTLSKSCWFCLLSSCQAFTWKSLSCLVSLTVSSQLLLFLELQLEYQFQEAFLDPQVLAGRHNELAFCVYWYVSPNRLKTAYRWKCISFYCILSAESKSWLCNGCSTKTFSARVK